MTDQTEQLLMILQDKVLNIQDSIHTYEDIISDIKEELGMNTPEFKLQFSIDKQPPDDFRPRRAKYKWLLKVRRTYINYLRDILNKRGQPAVGIPIFIDDSTNYSDEHTTEFRLKHLSVGSERFTRQYYIDKPNFRGTEVVYTHKPSKSGYQFWIVMWDIAKDILTLTVSTWIVDHNLARKRDTLYFARSYTFTEVPEYDPASTEGAPSPINYSPSLTSTSERIRALAFATAKEVTSDSPVDEGWVLTAAPDGINETMNRMRYLIEQFDMSGILRTMNDAYFKEQWFRQLASLFWKDNDVSQYLRTTDRLAESGILKHSWFQPNTTYPRDKEKYERNREEFKEVRKAYSIWADRFLDAFNGREVDLSEDVEFPAYPLHEPSPDDK